MATVRHRVGIRGSQEKIFDALISPEGLAGWWSSGASVDARRGGLYEVHFADLATLSFEITEFSPPHKLELKCQKGVGPWPECMLRFELQEDAPTNQVFLTLTHERDSASDEEFLYFNTKWPVYLLSLRDLLETGKGKPFPNAVLISADDR